EIVQANSSDIDVGSYSVPSFFDWNNDGLDDLIIGDNLGKVRVFLNSGTTLVPAFNNYFFAQADGSDLQVISSGCLGSFPRVVYWDDDSKKDLLVGSGTGTISIFLGTGEDNNPVFDAGNFVQANSSDISVGYRATSIFEDWNNDGNNDLIVGAFDGKIHLFINDSTNLIPDFQMESFADLGNSVLTVSSGRSSPIFYDFDRDGKKDLIAGNTDGQLLFYKNTNTVENPVLSNYVALTSMGVPLVLPGDYPRSRPSFCDWNNDAFMDVLIGATDGKVHLYRGLPEPSMFIILLFLFKFVQNKINFAEKVRCLDPK
ncbi:VCBS repeat-containing protein, partial [bacterium]|nr:VCBS repeat-containing protein [bacterium]